MDIWGGKSHGDCVVVLVGFGGGDVGVRAGRVMRNIASLKVDFEMGA